MLSCEAVPARRLHTRLNVKRRMKAIPITDETLLSDWSPETRRRRTGESGRRVSSRPAHGRGEMREGNFSHLSAAFLPLRSLPRAHRTAGRC